jgi:MFS family permease
MGKPGAEPGPEGGVAETPVSAEWVVAVARQAIGAVAPRELAVFDSVAGSWLADSERRRGQPGAAVGFGVEAVLLSQLIFPMISGGLGEVFGNAVWEQIRPRRKGAHKRSASQPKDTTPPTVRFTRRQSEALRAACLRHGVSLGLPADKAALLADAILGAAGAASTPGTAEVK